MFLSIFFFRGFFQFCGPQVEDICAEHGINFKEMLVDCLAEYAEDDNSGDPAWGNIFGSIATEKLIPAPWLLSQDFANRMNGRDC